MKALTSLVVVAPHYAVDYQMIVMECLENPDAAIQRKVHLSFTFFSFLPKEFFKKISLLINKV